MVILIVLGIALISLLINFLYQNIIKQKFTSFISKGLKKGISDLDHILSIKELGNIDYKNFIASRQLINQNEYKKEEYSIFTSTTKKNLIDNIFLDNLNLIIVFISSLFIFKNKMTPGTLMMFMSGTAFFLSPFHNSIDLLLRYSIIQEQIKLINFVFNFKEEEYFENGILIDKINKINLQDVTFGYEKYKNVLEISNLNIDQNIQIIGKNGIGKSTFLNILANNYEPNTRQIKFNNIEKKNLHIPYLKNNTFYSNPGIYLPETTIFEYITLNNDEYINTFNNNLEKYGIYKILNDIKLDLKTQMSNNGNNFSSGQKQMIILLRLFTKQYSLILLDEAFENLDTNITEKIFKAIKEYQNESLFIEISHSKKFIFKNKEVELEQINQIK
ncbi:MAG: ATP-binding cassette domain-containing protein [Metamycoplasmataceae bacterium]